MIQYGFLIKNNKQFSKDNRSISIASKLLLCLGVIILISALVYMIANLEKADSIFSLWLPFMIAGLFLVFVSQLVKWKNIRFERYMKTVPKN
jgi:uncharacterized membrane protein YkvI